MSSLVSEGYEVFRSVLSPGDIHSLRAAITETLDRVAAALRASGAASRPDAPLEERIDGIAQHDRAYAEALFRAALADSHRDPRIEALSRHSRLTPLIAGLLAPLSRTGQVIRPRATSSAFSSARHPWHQDVVRPSVSGCGSVRLACWMPLTAVDGETGALELILGRRTEPLPHYHHQDGVFAIADENLPRAPRRIIALCPGDVLVLDRYTPHRSLPLQHERARWAIAMWVKAESR